MRASISSNAKQLQRAMLARPAALRRELNAAGREIGAVVNAEAKTELQEQIYNVPIPLTAGADRRLGAKSATRGKTTKGKHGQWKRTGNLKRGETYQAKGAEITFKNVASYSAARAALGMPNPPNKAKRKAGIQRKQAKKPAAQQSKTRPVGNWQWTAILRKRAYILARRRAAILRALRRRR